MSNRCSGGEVAPRLRTVPGAGRSAAPGTESQDNVRITERRRPGRGPYPLSHFHPPAPRRPALDRPGRPVPAGGARSASAAAAKPAGPPITGVTWHQLTLINGWVSGPSQSLGESVPAWAVRNGVVYLDGSAVQTSGTNSEFAVLPPAARPSHDLYMPVDVLGQGTHGWIIIDPSGAMYATGVPSSSAQGFTGLAGISYPAQ